MTPSPKSSTSTSNLYYNVAKDKTNKNVIFSPVSLQTCLALAFLGAEGKTANELKEGMQLDGSTKEEVAQKFSKIFANTKLENVKLKLANRIYVDQAYELKQQFNELGSKYFEAAAEKVTFSDATATADKINTWVEQNTENKIQNLIDANSLDAETAAILVNAIYFKATWWNAFDDTLTAKKDFSVSKTQKTIVDMMSQEDNFKYGKLKDLDATAIEMRYVCTDITMLIVLPNCIDGLESLEEKLRNIDLTKLSGELSMERVNFQLPKFKIEFDISLQPVLEQLNIKNMFTPAADFSSLVASQSRPLLISEVKQKAFIEVNELGTEAAAATFGKCIPCCLMEYEVIYDFIADHPFFFVIKDKEHVYFAGHICNF